MRHQTRGFVMPRNRMGVTRDEENEPHKKYGTHYISSRLYIYFIYSLWGTNVNHRMGYS